MFSPLPTQKHIFLSPLFFRRLIGTNEILWVINCHNPENLLHSPTIFISYCFFFWQILPEIPIEMKEVSSFTQKKIPSPKSPQGTHKKKALKLNGWHKKELAECSNWQVPNNNIIRM